MKKSTEENVQPDPRSPEGGLGAKGSDWNGTDLSLSSSRRRGSSAFGDPQSAEGAGLTSQTAVEKRFCLRRNDGKWGFVPAFRLSQCHSGQIAFLLVKQVGMGAYADETQLVHEYAIEQ